MRAEAHLAAVAAPSVRWGWILDAHNDLVWYVGSAGIGWLYLLLVAAFGSHLARPIDDPFFVVHLGAHSLELTLGLLVVTSWAVLADAPHLFGTLARTYLDPEEWVRRRRVLLFALVWFVAGPAVILAPYLLRKLVTFPVGFLGLGTLLFTIFFRLWAYYHVVRQHWGFLSLYKKKNEPDAAAVENRADKWFFNASLYLPLLLFMTAPWYPQTPFPPTGLHLPIAGGVSAAAALHPVFAVLYPTAILGYLGFQFARWRRGVPRNGPKLLFLAAIVPLHFAVFAHPLLGLFVVPIVTVGHNLQYHRIVWMYGQRTYPQAPAARKRWTGPVFRRVWIYLALGWVFTFACYRGPWIAFFEQSLALRLDRSVFNGLGLLAGVADPSQVGLGAQVMGWFIAGWAMQHYYLDAKIWRVNRDAAVARSLNV